MTSHCTQKAFTSERKPQALFVVHSAVFGGHGFVWDRCRRWNSLSMLIDYIIMIFNDVFTVAFSTRCFACNGHLAM